MSVINTNVNALSAQNSMTVNSRNMSTAMNQLSTGKRVNGAKDDAAGLAVINTMTSQIRGLNQAVRNANDAISLLQTADGAMVEQTNMLQRMRELAVQSSNDTNNTDDRNFLNFEYQQLRTQISKIAEYTQWNGANILDGTAGNGSGYVTFQVGANANQIITIDLPNMRAEGSGMLSAIEGTAITDALQANAALAKIITALDKVTAARADMGAHISRLQFSIDNLFNVSTQSQQSRSRILDTDYAAATTELAKRNIIQQAAQAMLAQANQAPQLVLQLLK